MIRLSVNVNKVATLRNSRGGRVPSVVEAAETCIAAGVPGITVHPRADRRHITPEDVREIARALDGRSPHVEYNIEGDPRPALLDLVDEVRPDQCTLVPVIPGEITSQAGWRPGPDTERLPGIVSRLRALGVRVSLFVDASAPTGSSSTRSRTRVRSSAALKRGGGRSRPTLRRRASHTRSGSASTLGTISISPTSSSSASCRFSTKSRSGTPSCLVRCSSAFQPSSASTWPCSRPPRDWRGDVMINHKGHKAHEDAGPSWPQFVSSRSL